MKDKFRLFFVLTSLLLAFIQALNTYYFLSLIWFLLAGLHLALFFLANDDFKAAILSGLLSFWVGLIAIFLVPAYRTHLLWGWFLIASFTAIIFYHRLKGRKEG